MQARTKRNKKHPFSQLGTILCVDLDYQNSEIRIPSCRMPNQENWGMTFLYQ